jgi:hypothetical protein
VNQFLWGISAGLSLAVTLFFLKYWQDTRERLFFAFSSAFLVLAAHWVVLAASDPADPARHYVFLMRLLAFVFISAGILDKNRRAARRER